MAKQDEKKPGTAVAAQPTPSTAVGEVIDYGTDAGLGFEGTTKDDYAIPFLQVLQKMSPQVDEAQGDYLPDAKPGMFINTVTKELTPGTKGVRFIPVHRTHQFLEWVPREQGGGLVGVYQTDDPRVADFLGKVGKQRIKSVDGKSENDLIETFSIFGLLLTDDGAWQPVILNFASTQIKHYKQWMTRAQGIKVRTDHGMVTPPLFSHVYRLTTKVEENNKGTWHGLVINFDGANATEARLKPTDELYLAAKKFREVAAKNAETSLRNASQPVDAEGAGETGTI